MWKRYECQRLRINSVWKRTSRGQVEILLGMFGFLLVLFVMLFGLKVAQFMITGAYVEDALAASNLASALIDVEQYGRDNTIRVKDPRHAFEIYREALFINLQLDEEGNSFQRELLQGPVRILSYIVYNVRQEGVDMYSFDGEGHLIDTRTELPDAIYTPDHVLVETTTIYSQVEFIVQGMGEQYITVRKEKSVDITRSENE